MRHRARDGFAWWSWLRRSVRPKPPGPLATASALPSPRRLAVLIDGDNASHRLLGALFRELGHHGQAVIRRVYGDWTSPNLAGWREPCEHLGVLTVHQARASRKKNSTDVALVIDAMDILHSRKVGGFCIVSSDGDFTRLALRIKEDGLWLAVCGNHATPSALRHACDLFLSAEELRTGSHDPEETWAGTELSDPGSATMRPGKGRLAPPPLELAEKLLAAYNASRIDGDPAVPLAGLGDAIGRMIPGLDPRAYGHTTLPTLLQSTGLFELRTGSAPASGRTVTMVRLRGGLAREKPVDSRAEAVEGPEDGGRTPDPVASISPGPRPSS